MGKRKRAEAAGSLAIASMGLSLRGEDGRLAPGSCSQAGGRPGRLPDPAVRGPAAPWLWVLREIGGDIRLRAGDWVLGKCNWLLCLGVGLYFAKFYAKFWPYFEEKTFTKFSPFYPVFYEILEIFF